MQSVRSPREDNGVCVGHFQFCVVLISHCQVKTKDTILILYALSYSFILIEK